MRNLKKRTKSHPVCHSTSRGYTEYVVSSALTSGAYSGRRVLCRRQHRRFEFSDGDISGIESTISFDIGLIPVRTTQLRTSSTSICSILIEEYRHPFWHSVKVFPEWAKVLTGSIRFYTHYLTQAESIVPDYDQLLLEIPNAESCTCNLGSGMKSLKNAGIHPGLLGLVEIDLTDLIPREVSPHAQT